MGNVSIDICLHALIWMHRFCTKHLRVNIAVQQFKPLLITAALDKVSVALQYRVLLMHLGKKGDAMGWVPRGGSCCFSKNAMVIVNICRSE